MGAITGLMTFEAFERLPEHDQDGGKLELLDGEPIRMPPAFAPHMRVAIQLFLLLHHALQSQFGGKTGDLGEVWIETGYHFGHNWLVPDVSITHAGQKETNGKYLVGAPALAVEVISESNTAAQMHRKVRRYLENGAQEVWIVYPDTHSVSICRGNTIEEVQGTLTTELLPGQTINLNEIFAA